MAISPTKPITEYVMYVAWWVIFTVVMNYPYNVFHVIVLFELMYLQTKLQTYLFADSLVQICMDCKEVIVSS